MKDTKQVRLNSKTIQRLKDFHIEASWIELNSYDEKINFLLWFYSKNVDNT